MAGGVWEFFNLWGPRLKTYVARKNFETPGREY
jgi:hypothetical protein